jgi:phage baseplate assembly protein W
MAGGFGTSGFGTSPYGSSSAVVVELGVVDVLAKRENLIELTFNAAPRFTQTNDPRDASDPRRYTVTPELDSFDRMGFVARPVRVVQVEQITPTVLHLWLDRAMSAEPALYKLKIEGLVSAADGTSMAAQELILMALFRGMTIIVPEYAFDNKDLANPHTKRGVFDNQEIPIGSGENADKLLGVYPVNSSGDIASDGGLTGVEKRITRRLTTRRGSFLHLPNYGVSAIAMVKQLNRPGVRSFVADEAVSQIREEPEVVDCSVEVVSLSDRPNIVYYKVKARTKIGKNIALTVPVLGE